jgi:hypothetical protein
MEWNKPKIKFYKFYFIGKKKPVIMEAYSREEADRMLNQLNDKTSAIDFTQIEDVRIEMPIRGVSKRKRLGKEYIWVGEDYSTDGWMEESEFKTRNDV